MSAGHSGPVDFVPSVGTEGSPGQGGKHPEPADPGHPVDQVEQVEQVEPEEVPVRKTNPDAGDEQDEVTDGYDAFVALLDRRVTEAYPGAQPEPKPSPAPEPALDEPSVTAPIPVAKGGRGPEPRRIAVIAGCVALVLGLVAAGFALGQPKGEKDQGSPGAAALAPGDGQSPAPSGDSQVLTSASPTQKPAKHDGKPKKDGEKADPTEGPKGKPKSGAKASAKPAGAQSEDATSPSKASSGPETSQAATETTTVTTVGVIRNLMTSFCVDLPTRDAVGTGAAVKQYTCSSGSSDNQEYQTVAQADGTFLLRNAKSQVCLDLSGPGSVATGSAVTTGTCLIGSQDNQMWRRQYVGNGFFLVHVKSGLCLNVSNPNGVDNKVLGLNITLFTCSATDDHVWQFG